MAYDVTTATGMGPGINTGKAIGGAIGLFAIIGLGLGIFGLAAAFGVPDTAAVDPGAVQVENVMAAGSLLLIGIAPFVMAPLLALGVGAWAGHATRSAGQGAAAGAVAGFVGPIVMFILMGLGVSIGAAAAGVDVAALTTPLAGAPITMGEAFGAFLTGAGLLFLIVHAVAGALAGALIGSLLPEARGPVGVEEAGRRPAGA